MKGKFDAYVLWPLAKIFHYWIVDWSTTRDFTVCGIFCMKSVRQFVNILWDGRVNIDFVHLFWRWDKNDSTFRYFDAFSSIFPIYTDRNSTFFFNSGKLSCLHRRRFFFNDKSQNSKRYPFANVKSFWHLMWKMFCHSGGANSIKTNLQTCNLHTGQSINYKSLN